MSDRGEPAPRWPGPVSSAGGDEGPEAPAPGDVGDHAGSRRPGGPGTGGDAPRAGDRADAGGDAPRAGDRADAGDDVPRAGDRADAGDDVPRAGDRADAPPRWPAPDGTGRDDAAPRWPVPDGSGGDDAPRPDDGPDASPRPGAVRGPSSSARPDVPPGFRRFAWPPEPIRPPSSPGAAGRAAAPASASAAGLLPRLGATAVDAFLTTVVWLVASVLFLEILSAMGSLDPSLLDTGSVNGLQLTDAQVRIGFFMFAILVAIRGFYLVYAWSRIGATFGQQLVSIRVLDVTTGKPLSVRRALIRWIVSELPGASLLISVAILVWYAALAASIQRSPARRGFHDEAAGCIVVQHRRGAGGAIG